jgi:hypothetical protein
VDEKLAFELDQVGDMTDEPYKPLMEQVRAAG